ncbi:MAG: hypothetical protein AVDCRST_MAG30-4108, partial [uncultured Solirubrobacteraceae bacterium]
PDARDRPRLRWQARDLLAAPALRRPGPDAQAPGPAARRGEPVDHLPRRARGRQDRGLPARRRRHAPGRRRVPPVPARLPAAVPARGRDGVLRHRRRGRLPAPDRPDRHPRQEGGERVQGPRLRLDGRPPGAALAHRPRRPPALRRGHGPPALPLDGGLAQAGQARPL